ncbi:MAG: hypothetical protein M1822_002460 [Bathelium mastoideum]|nr:MAG: hypothetical protein M1822_002460 [Bathelium mastoideum]
MADGLSVAASIAGLVSLADVVVRRLYKYGSEVRGAREEVNKLIVEVSAFYGLLQSLKLLAEELSNETRFQTLELPFVYTCQKVLEEIRTKLDKHTSTGGRWKWPLSSSETKNLLQGVERQKSTVAVALAANNTHAILAALGGLEGLQNGVNNLREKLEHKLEVDSRIKLDKEREGILDKFSILVPRISYETNLRLRHPGTGIWLIESDEFKAWVSTSNSGLWLYGIPGAGKSVLAVSIIEFVIAESAAESSENAAVYFFCDYKTPETQVPSKIMASLVRQLARQSQPAFELVESFYKKRISQGNQWSQPSAEQLVYLFVQMSRFFANCMVIVDGVDECGGNQVEVAELLSDLREGSSTVKVLSLSRDEQDIRQSITDFEKMSIAARNSDIRLYVAAEIEQRINNKKLRLRDATLKGVIMDKLIDGAQGMFRWVTCQMDYLCELPTDSSRRKALQTLPPTLFETYERILDRANEKHPCSQRIVQRALRWTISWPGFNLSVKALCEAVSIDDDAVRLDPDSIPDEEEILRLCSSLLCEIRSIDGVVLLQPAHFTVREFLTQIDPVKQPKFAPYRIDLVTDSIWTQRIALLYLCFRDFNSPPVDSLNELKKKYKKYPLRFSIMKSFQNGSSSDSAGDPFAGNLSTDTLLHTLLDKSRPMIFLSWAQEYGLARQASVFNDDFFYYDDCSDSDLRKMTRRILSAQPLHFAASLGYADVCSALIADGANPNHLSDIGSPLHCAILGPGVFRESLGRLWRDSKILLGPYYSTAKALLAAGADPNKSWCPVNLCHGQRQTWSVVQMCIERARNLLPDICRAGAQLSAGDFQSLIELPNDPDLEDTEWLKDLKDSNWFKELIDVIDIEGLDDSNRTTLANLAFACSPQQTKFQAADMTKDTAILNQALIFMVTYGQTALLCNILYENPDLALDSVKDDRDAPLLIIAADHDHSDIVQLLLDRGANPNQVNSSGTSALHISSRRGSTQSLVALLNAGGDPLRMDGTGSTAFHAAAAEDHVGLLRFLVERSEGTYNLKTCRSRVGGLPCHSAALTGSCKALEYLVDLSGSADIQDDHGRGILHYAVDGWLMDIGYARPNHDYVNVIRFSIERGCDPTQQDQKGYSPISEVLNHPRLDQQYTAPEIVGLMFNNKACRLSYFQMLTEVFAHQASVRTYGGVGYEDEWYTLLETVWDEMLRHTSWTDENDTRAWANLMAGSQRPLMSHSPGDTFLHLICRLKKPGMIQRMLRKCLELDAHCDIRDANKNTPLMVVSGRGYTETCKTLLDKGADVNAQNVEKSTPLLIAAGRGCTETCETLLDRGADVNAQDVDESTPLLIAAGRGYTETCETLLDRGADVNAQNIDKLTPLLTATGSGHNETVKFLLDKGANITATDSFGRNVAYYACECNNVNILEMIKDKQVDWDAKAEIKLDLGFDYYTWAHVTAMNGSNDSLEYLLQTRPSSEHHHPSGRGASPLAIAASRGNATAVSLLLGAGAKVNSLCVGRYSGWTVLDFAAYGGHPDMVRLLLDKAVIPQGAIISAMKMAQERRNLVVAEILEAHIEAKDHTDRRCFRAALRSAIKEGDIGWCQRLVNLESDLNSALQPCQCTPLLWALHHRQWDIALFLAKKGATARAGLCEHTSRFVSALHICVSGGALDLFIYIVRKEPEIFDRKFPLPLLHVGAANDRVEFLNILLTGLNGIFNPLPIDVRAELSYPLAMAENEAGFDVEKRSTALHIACCTGSLRFAELLLERGAHVDAAEGNGKHPLHYAARNGCPGMIRLLISNAVNIDAQDHYMISPAMIAAENSHFECLRLLVEAGADLELCNIWGQQMLHRTASRGHASIVAYLWSRNLRLTSTDSIGGDACLAGFVSNSRPLRTFLLNCGEDISCSSPVYGSILHEVLLNTVSCLPWVKNIVRRLGTQRALELINEKPTHFVTLLYLAVALNEISVIQFFLNIGAEVDADGGPEGTALMAAATAGRLDAVRLLVDAGASITYWDRGHLMNGVKAAKHHPDVLRWFLVGRFTKRRFIGA